MADKRSDFENLFGDVTDASDDLEAFLSENDEKIIDLARTARPTLELLARYSPEYVCLFKRLADAVPVVKKVFGEGSATPALRVQVVLTRGRGKFLPGQDEPEFTDDRGPRCYDNTPPMEQYPGGPYEDGAAHPPPAAPGSQLAPSTPFGPILSAKPPAVSGPAAPAAPALPLLGGAGANAKAPTPPGVPGPANLLPKAEIGPPTDTQAQGTLADGAIIPVERTNRFPEVEELFGALSMLLNGGGIGQVQNIAQELNKALDGREGDTKALLRDLNTLVGTLDAQRHNITRALDGVNTLSVRLSEQRGNLDAVLTDLEPGLAVLNEQRPQLVGMLKSLDKLSDVAKHVVDKSHKDLVADLEALRPTLRELAQTGDSLPESLEVLVTPPFTDAAIKPAAGRAMNLDFELNIDLVNLLGLLLTTPPALPPLPALPALPAPLNTLPSLPSSGPVSDLLPKAPTAALPKAPPAPKAPDGLRLPGLGGN